MNWIRLTLAISIVYSATILPAQAQRVDCPARNIRAEITTRLPSPWWQTPQEGRLVDTDIANVGGKLTLVCRYRAYGATVSVMREMPRGARRCTPRRGGFTCDGDRAGDRGDRRDTARRPDDRDRPRRRSGGVNHVSGSIDVRQTWMFDLDTGRLTKNQREADLWFEANSAARRYLTPRNGATIAVMGARAPGYEGCARAKLSSRKVNLRKLRRGVYLCMRTNRGRVAYLKVIRGVKPSPKPISLGFATFK